MKLVALTVLFALSLGTSVQSQPICYMVDNSGRTRDLSGMCGRTAVISDRAIPTAQNKTPAKDYKAEVRGRRFVLKPMGDGRKVRLWFLENGRDEFWVLTGSKDLRVANTHRFSYSCPGEAELIGVFSTSGGRTVENPVNTVDEMQRVAVERASKQAVGMACQGQNIPASGSY